MQLYQLLDRESNWYEIDKCFIIVPPIEKTRVPKAVIHFVGGFLLGAYIPVSYATLLTELGNNGFLVVATPIPAIDNKHGKVAENALKAFSDCYYSRIRSILGVSFTEVPVIGLSHSLGGKITILMGSLVKERKTSPKRFGNVFLAFNNFGLKDSLNLTASQALRVAPPDVRSQMQDSLRLINNLNVDELTAKVTATVTETVRRGLGGMADDLLSSDQQAAVSTLLTQFTNTVKSSIPPAASMPIPPGLGLQEFDPSPEETWQLLLKGYNVPKNILFKFSNDQIDQSFSCARVLGERGCDAAVKQLPGSHLTPCALLSAEDLLTAYSVDASALSGAQGERALDGVQSPADVQQARTFLRQLILTLNDIALQANGNEVDNGAGFYQKKQSYDLPPSDGDRGRDKERPKGGGERRRYRWDDDEV